MTETPILVADSGPIRTITLNRPERRNALTAAMQSDLVAALEDAAASGCRALVLTGAGHAFCSGLDLADLRAMQDKSAAEYRAGAELIARLFRTLYEMPIPTIASVEGPAIAGGTGLATLCDFTLAAPDAKFGFTEARIGFVPALVSAFAALQIGDKRCRDLFLTARLFDAEEALRLGLVNEVVPAERLPQRVLEFAESLIANSPQSIRLTKQLLAAQHRPWLDASIAAAIDASVQARETRDFREGVAAFLEKRSPAWPAPTDTTRQPD
ncbi:MAG TPA: enoyl-CoA hydratase-related protein [Terracidiphilus sp.]|nr:enoyl-CoA hydratase-related protein [Terracidiphilus sp.]